ncbi:MAG: hypothetical protein H0T46_07855, partial [Deltaproteobacteria bacterium]|nr:hypothetical protein [Deltaproteobacteria bacterium]
MRQACGALIAVAAMFASASATPRLLPPPAHLDAFRAAWGDARACLVKEPRTSNATGCAAVVGRALAAARAGDADRGYHVAWRMIERALLELGDEPDVERVAGVDTAEAALR